MGVESTLFTDHPHLSISLESDPTKTVSMTVSRVRKKSIARPPASRLAGLRRTGSARLRYDLTFGRYIKLGVNPVRR